MSLSNLSSLAHANMMEQNQHREKQEFLQPETDVQFKERVTWKAIMQTISIQILNNTKVLN